MLFRIRREICKIQIVYRDFNLNESFEHIDLLSEFIVKQRLSCMRSDSTLIMLNDDQLKKIN